jgi:hypothetical protein
LVVSGFSGCRNASKDQPQLARGSQRDTESTSVSVTLQASTGRLTAADFIVLGISAGMDSTAVRAVLGSPDSVTLHDDFRDPGAKFIAWHFSKGLTVLLGSYNQVGGVTITGQGIPTARGLVLGDTDARLTELYGPPSGKYLVEWEYQDPSEELHVMRVIVVAGRVTQIYVGYIFD